MTQDITATIAWAENYIKEFNQNEGFDPYAALMNTESKTQRIFNECVNLIQGIELSVETFRNHRDFIVFKEG